MRIDPRLHLQQVDAKLGSRRNKPAPLREDITVEIQNSQIVTRTGRDDAWRFALAAQPATLEGVLTISRPNPAS
jgi:hypothetical protein